MVATLFDELAGLALDDNGVLYFSNQDTVFRVADKNVTTWWPGGSFASGFIEAGGVAIDANGDLHVADNSESGIRITRVKVLDDGSAGAVTEVVIVPGDNAYRNIEFGPTGELFVLNNRNKIWAIRLADDGTVTSLRLLASITGDHRALTFDASGTLYVGTDAGTVWSVDSVGEPTMVATGFDSIGGMAFDASGALYLAGEKEVLKILTR